MKVHIYSTKAPSGRCCLMALQVSEVLGVYGLEALNLAERLFDGQYSWANPFVVALDDLDQVRRLRSVCSEYGIDVGFPE